MAGWIETVSRRPPHPAETPATVSRVDDPPRGDARRPSPGGHAAPQRRSPTVSRMENAAYWGGVPGPGSGFPGSGAAFFPRARRLLSISVTISVYGPSRNAASASLPAIPGSA